MWAALCAVAVSTFFCTFNSAEAVEMPDVSAKAAIVINADTGEVLFRKNAQQRLAMASTTKIMTTILAIEHGNLDQQFTVDAQAVKTEGSSMGLVENDKVTLRALCYGMMLPSGNDAANCAAVRVSGSVEKFVELMNEKAQQIGLKDTHFVTPSGLDDQTDEHYSTAGDMAMLTRYAVQNSTFREICSTKKVKLRYGNPPYDRWLSNTNKLLETCHGVIGVKTGFTDKAGRCLVSFCSRNGSELICVTLSDKNDWQDHSRLYDKCFTFVSRQTLSPENTRFELNVVGSDRDSIKCHAEPVKACLINGRAKDVTAVVHLPRFVYATVRRGDIVGCTEFWYNGEMIAKSGIYADMDAEYVKAECEGFLEGIKSKLVGLFSDQ